MFKLESYITPILLSYVDKYIKNFRPEDSQVSLWGGDVSFHNLDLRLEVLEEELQLPFSFVSGHIHELLIHVPWTKLASEPITITINTIECILKLKGDPSDSDVATCSSGGTPGGNIGNATKEKKKTSKKQEMEAPPGYVQSLVNKIVGNICINCNNLILKYVEEDIVVSMNIKLLTVESANQLWQPAFAELSPTQVLIRKLITLTDLTVCLDRRNAAGKIDVYQEPMLYRCSLEIRLMRKYFSATAKRTSTTRIDIHCNSMEFSMTTQQLPMLMRLINLIITLHSKELRREKAVVSTNESDITDDGSGDDPPVMGWAGWAWSLVPSILPTWDEEWAADQQAANIGHTIHLGLYIDNAVFSFKVSESSNEKTYYAPRKLKYWPILSLRLGGVFFDNVAHGIGWVNCQAGIARASLLPAGDCTCGAEEVIDNTQPQEYFKSSLNDVESFYWNDSLQDPDSPENNGQRRMYNVSWDIHLANITEDYLMARSPAFAMDYLYQLEVPEHYQSDNLSELGSDLEYSNLTEKVLLRVVVGPFTLRYSAGLMHRIEMLHQAAQLYDYMPYVSPKRLPSFAELPPPSSEDFDALNECIPLKTVQIISVRPAIEIVLWDHAQNKHRKKTQSLSALGQLSSSNSLTKTLPKLRIEIEYVDARMKFPIYPNRLVYTTCKLPNPPKTMLDSCYTMTDIKCRGLKANLIIKDKSTTVLIPSHINYAGRHILKEQYWLDKDICLSQHSLTAESIAIAGTKSKFMVIWYIIDSILNPNLEQPSPIFNTTLMFDAYRDTAMECLELNIEDINFTSLQTVCTHTIQSTVGACKAFIIEPDIKYDKENPSNNKTGLGYVLISGMSESVKMKMNESANFLQPQQVMILSGPEPDLKCPQNVNSSYLFSVTAQVPLTPGVPDHPALFLFNLADFRISIDPMFCRWLQYKPRLVIQRADRMNVDPSVQKRRRVSEASGGSLETPRRTGPQPTSVHSSSERDLIAHTRSIPLRTLSPSPERTIHEETNYFKFLLNWYSTWRCLLVHGDISHITIYFPTIPIPALGAQDLQGAFLNNINLNTDLEIVIVKLPSVSIRSASQRQNLSPYMLCYPIKLPDSIWTDSKKSFPWNISVTDFSCYTIHSNKKYFFVKPVSCNATIAVTTKSYGVNVSENQRADTNIKLSKSENLSDRSNEVLNKSGTDFPAKVPSLIQITNTIAPNNKDSPFQKDLISSMGICVHVDTMPFLICMSEEQVALISSITVGLLEVSSSIFPEQDLLPTPVQVKRSLSPPTPPEILFRESTKESTISGASKSVEDVDSNDTPKLTLFVQWTLTRFSIALYGNEGITHLKLLLDMEDIVNSLDMQHVYLKLKAKIATASIRHFKRNDNNKLWTVGPYLGLVMRGRESSSLVSEENCFASITFTRARCMNVHSRWGQTKKTKGNKKAPTLNRSSARYLSELMITLQSVDFVLSPKTLSSFILVLNPLRCMAVRNPSAIIQSTSSSTDSNLQSITTAILPLIYLDVRGLRIILPSAKKLNCKMNQDVYIMQVDHVILTPSADNPICRAPLRPDMYQQAAQAGLLNIPGSEMEDRQYQLTASSLSASTSSWHQLEHCLSLESTAFNLRTMNENPALEWNNLDSKRALSSHLTIIPVISKFDLCIVAAPAMVHGSTVICGHAMEINCVSDVDVNLSTTQLILAQALGVECGRILDPVIAENSKKKHARVIYPYSKLPPQMPLTEEELLLNEFRLENSTCSNSHIDSGVDVCDIGSDNAPLKTTPVVQPSYSKHSIPETTDYTAFTKRFTEKQKRNFCDVDTFVPLELLFTGGTITFGLYQVCYATERRSTQVNSSLITLETGYEASEEGSLNEELNPETVTVPFLQLQICQPNTLVSRNAYDSRFQFSVFDIKFSISHPDCSLKKLVPSSSDYNVVIIETKPGLPHQVTGIPPALATIRWSTGVGKSETVDVNIARPVKIYVSVEKFRQINEMQRTIWCCMKGDTMIHKSTNHSPPIYPQPVNTTYAKFAYIKSQLFGIGHFNLNITQIVLNFKIDDNHQIDIAVAKIKNRLTITHRPERIQANLNFDSLTISLINKNISKMLLNPWSFDFYINLFWENWQQRDADPLIHINADSDCFDLSVGPDHITILEKFKHEFNKLIDEIRYTKYSEYSLNEDANRSIPLKTIPSDSKAQYQDQHYKDDLRAGAFQFVDATVGEEIPLAYQVLFWAGVPGTGSMAWRYPQPRALTRVHIYPVPFQINSDDPSNQTVHCQLEYFSEVHGSFLPYIQFKLSECNMLRLNMPNEIPDLAVSSIWRVLLSSSHLETATQYHRKQAKAEFHAKHNIDFGLLVSPRALAACMRIDSFFSASLVPNIKIVFNLSSMQINLHNHINLGDGFTLPAPIKTCHIDGILPPDQAFLFFSLDSSKVHLCMWKNESVLVDVNTNIKCNVVDYGFLTIQNLIEPFSAKLTLSTSDIVNVSFIAKPIVLKFGPSIAHTIAVSEQVWRNSLNFKSEDRQKPELSIISRYVVHNDTNLTLRFGQAATDENLFLLQNCCTFYVWRSHKKKQLLRVGIEELDLIWSNTFQIEQVGNQFLTFERDENITIIIKIELLSATQKLITFSGSLKIVNTLTERFEMKIFPLNIGKKENYLSNSSTHIVVGHSNSPSLVANCKLDLGIRLRFQGLDSSWSGDIPLKDNPRTSQPWLVKGKGSALIK